MAESCLERRKSVRKTVGTLWSKSTQDEQLQTEDEGQDVRERKMTVKAGKFELKRKMTGVWLEKSKSDEKEN